MVHSISVAHSIYFLEQDFCVGGRCPGAGRGAAGWFLWEEARAALCQTQLFQPAPMVSPQGTAEPSSQDGGISTITYSRKGKKRCATAAGKEKCEINSLADTKVSEEGRGGAEIPLQPLEYTMVMQVVPL